mmetsp:Transcript_34851/g.56060  ORF Transcript_34851/g.56060 Transcript_34851/m.56060 type:complete len:141 (+) Transcript_34851:116-538(+)|eukprot:jgi/Bigna1/68073/fgenesh1_pg.5_\
MWDLRRLSEPFKRVSTCQTDPSLFDEMCTSGCLVDDFRVVCNENATGFVTGTYDNFFMIYDVKDDKKHYIQARHQYDQKQASAPVMEEYTKKVLHVDWNRRRNVVSAASAHSVYIYQQEKVNAESKVGGSRSMDMKAMDS